jgi:hypothetical protein
MRVPVLARVLATHPLDEFSQIKAKMSHGSVCHTNLMGVNLHLTFVIQTRIA